MNRGEEIHPDQAQLLLYLAGETSAVERRAIEARLAGDAGLRQQLDELRRVESAVNQCLSAVDTSDTLDARLPAIERQAAKAISQWQVDRLSPVSAQVARTKIRRVPVWMYPLSAAALVMVCLGVWWLSLEALPEGVLAMPGAPPRGAFENFPLPESLEEREQRFDLALNDTGSESYDDLERDMATFQTLNEALQ